MTRQLALMGVLALLLLVGTGGAFAQSGPVPPFGYQPGQGQATGTAPLAAAGGTGCAGNTRNGICGLAPGADLAVTCPTLLQIRAQLPQELRLACIAATATPTSNVTSTPGATAPPTLTQTVLATLTSTLVPTSPPTAVATGTPSGTLIEGVPICTDHNATIWHPLVKRDAAGAILCTYGHEHHANPHDVDDLFGPPGAWYGGSQEISYPWQTFAFTSQGVQYEMPAAPADPSVYENATKHNGYKWYVKRDLPCIPFGPQYGPGCVLAYRVQVHSMGTHHDATVRFHSFSAEALVSINGVQGMVRGGGWMNTGFLGLVVDSGQNLVCPPLATNPPGLTCPATGTAGGHRENGSVNPPPPHTPWGAAAASHAWYADHNSGITVTLSVDDFGPVDYTDPNAQLFYPPEQRANNSQGQLGSLLARSFEPLAPAADGTLTGVVYKNRHGAVVTGCTAAGLDCVPFTLEHVVANSYASFNQVNAPTVYAAPDFDVASPVTGNSLVTFPN